MSSSCFFGGGGGGGGSGSADDGSSGGGGESPQVGYDLQLTEFDFLPKLQGAGGSLQITESVQNVGDEDAPAFRVGVYLSTDSDVTTEDVLLGFRSLAQLEVDAESESGGTLTVPIGTLPGYYYLGAIADDEGQLEESALDNNVLVAADRLEVGNVSLPDLRMTDVSFMPPQVESGETIEVTDRVLNSGNASSGPFQVGVYISQDATITTSDILLGFRSIQNLDAGQSNAGDGPLTVPSSTPSGTYFLGVIADDGGHVIEFDELNNVLAALTALTVTQPPLPDLAATHLQFTPSVLQAGQHLNIDEGVRNDGEVDSTTCQVAVYLSTDAVISIEDQLLGFRTLPSLPVGDSSAVQDVDLVVPTDIPGGVYWVGLFVDHTELVSEIDEANNFFIAAGQLEVTVPLLPDLRSIALTFSPSVIDRDISPTMIVNEEVENTGAASAGAFRVSVYLSPNPTITTSDFLLGSRTIQSLDVGASSGAVSDMTVPAGIPTGTYYVGLIADDQMVIGELSEGNNLLIAASTVDIVDQPDPLPDLVITGMEYNLHLLPPGGTMQVVTRVTNEGDLSAGPFELGVYLSLDEEIDTSDLLIAQRHITHLGVGFTNVNSLPVTIPLTTPEDTYYVGALADIDDTVVEDDEENNGNIGTGQLVVAWPPPPAPNLKVIEITHGTSSASPGDSFDVTDMIRNAGNEDAGASVVGIYLSLDIEITSADVLIGTRDIPTLTPSEENTGTHQVTIPTDTAVGIWFLGAIADHGDVVSESNETDNVKMATGSIDIQ